MRYKKCPNDSNYCTFESSRQNLQGFRIISAILMYDTLYELLDEIQMSRLHEATIVSEQHPKSQPMGTFIKVVSIQKSKARR